MWAIAVSWQGPFARRVRSSHYRVYLLTLALFLNARRVCTLLGMDYRS